MFDAHLLFVALAWGVNFSIVKFALTDFHPLAFTVVRFSLAALFLFAVMLLRREPLIVERQDRFAVMKLGFVGITLYNVFFMYGLKYTTAANSALLISLSPLFGALIQTASGSERLTARAATGLCLASLGVFFIIKSHYGGLGFSSSRIIGDLLTLCATITWAFYTISAKPLLEHYSAVKVTAYSMASGSLLLLPVSLPALFREPWESVSTPSWAAMAFSALVAAGAAYVLWYRGVKRLGVRRTMVYHYIMPLAAVLFAAVAFHERITILQISGGTAILAGVYLVQSEN